MFSSTRPLDLPLELCIGKQANFAPSSSCFSLLNQSIRLANCMSMVTLTIAAAMFTQYWGPGFGVPEATFVLLVLIVLMNACGVRVSG